MLPNPIHPFAPEPELLNQYRASDQDEQRNGELDRGLVSSSSATPVTAAGASALSGDTGANAAQHDGLTDAIRATIERLDTCAAYALELGIHLDATGAGSPDVIVAANCFAQSQKAREIAAACMRLRGDVTP